MIKAPKQQLFIREYPVDFNATQAAIRAGYSERTAGQAGHRLLDNPEIQAEIRRAQEAAAAEGEIAVKNIIEGLKSVAYPADDEHVNNSDKLRALELLGKYKAIFTEKTQHTVIRPIDPPSDPKEREPWLIKRIESQQEELKLLQAAREAGSALVK